MYGPNRPRLGAQARPVAPTLAEELGLPAAQGAYVSEVDAGTPGQRAGLMPGDIIVRFDGQDVREVTDLVRFVNSSPVGKAIHIVIIRNGTEERLTVTL
jgi:serine protease Do